MAPREGGGDASSSKSENADTVDAWAPSFLGDFSLLDLPLSGDFLSFLECFADFEGFSGETGRTWSAKLSVSILGSFNLLLGEAKGLLP